MGVSDVFQISTASWQSKFQALKKIVKDTMLFEPPSKKQNDPDGSFKCINEAGVTELQLVNEICVPSRYTERTMAAFALMIIVIMVQLSAVTGCSCAFRNPRTKYCTSEYAVRGKVTKLTYGDGLIGVNAERIYEVEILKVYKGNIIEEKEGTVQIRTAGSDSVCGVGLKVNKEYLINGYIHNRQMRIRLCDMMFFSHVDGTNRDFPTYSEDDCKCKIENIILRVGHDKPEKVCALGNRFRCSSASDTPGDLAECKYNSNTDDCDWTC
ncbi:uncharacterized protein LOC133201649 [Saccostrea echinata]|uniref:uncharacterized protein LOC133201649 n=1 Tax=Saccostrea echinata TaxID=191078 RepID=UPI002A7FB250|nr:uncharacterized protein LOC133201649 [Saccostrea echinata]